MRLDLSCIGLNEIIPLSMSCILSWPDLLVLGSLCQHHLLLLLFACHSQLQFGDLLMGRLLRHQGGQSALDGVHGVE